MKHNRKWKIAVIAICLLSVTALGLGIYAAAANAKAEKYKLQIANNYQHAFEEKSPPCLERRGAMSE